MFVALFILCVCVCACHKSHLLSFPRMTSCFCTRSWPPTANTYKTSTQQTAPPLATTTTICSITGPHAATAHSPELRHMQITVTVTLCHAPVFTWGGATAKKVTTSSQLPHQMLRKPKPTFDARPTAILCLLNVFCESVLFFCRRDGKIPVNIHFVIMKSYQDV